MKKAKFIAVLAMLVLTGCVTGTRNIELGTPDFSTDKTASGKIYISSIQDKRVFEQAPRDPSTPSVRGTLSDTSKEKLATLVGRQRNGYGGAMGDVALTEGSVVQDEVRALITKGLESRGYEVVDDESAPTKVSIDVEKFWAWFSPGFVSVSFESNLQCNVEFEQSSGTERFEISGYGKNKGQVASNANWVLAFERAYMNFLENMDKALDSKGL